MDLRQAADGRIRKRKADNYDTNERLHKVSKRLSQLNLGTCVYFYLHKNSLIDTCQNLMARSSTFQ
jgi:hypothetical protein